jgi:pyrroline-5-carboxylate reductase
MQFPDPTWLVGCGNMGGAMVDGWRLAGVDLSKVVVIRPSGIAVDGISTVTSFAEAGPPPKLVLLAFKPQKLAEIASLLAPWLTSKATVVSILAGVEAATLRQYFPKVGAIVRAMPNLPVAVRRGIVTFYSPDADEARKGELMRLAVPLGIAHWAYSESELAAIGSIAGAGPAYVARFIAALAKAGEKRGLDPKLAAMIARETVFGTGWIAASGRESMDEIARRVASPNGTTEAGLQVLDRDDVLDQLIEVTIAAAARRGAELAEEARSGAQVDSLSTLP